MSGFDDWFDPNSRGGVLAVIFTFVVVMALATQAPGVLVVLATLAFLGWVGVRSGLLERSHESDAVDATDPFVTLQQRYASGELSKEEFERRVDELLSVDARAGRDNDRELETEHN